jgi:hypothetical protein
MATYNSTIEIVAPAQITNLTTTNLQVNSGNIGLGSSNYISTTNNQLTFFNGTTSQPLSGEPLTGLYWTTANAPLSNGNTQILWNASAPYSDTTAITWTNPSRFFTVNTTGLYQLDFHINQFTPGVLWTSAQNLKTCAIDVARPPGGFQTITGMTVFQAIQGAQWVQQTNALFPLQAGDVVTCRMFNQVSTGTASTIVFQSPPDYNTFFTWQLVKRL